MKLNCKEKWNDGSSVDWSAVIKEIPLDDLTLAEWYDRDARTNRELIETGGVVRAFVVESIEKHLPQVLLDDEEQPVAGVEFDQISIGDKLVVLMNHREWMERNRGPVSADFNPWPTLLNVQDCGFDVEVEE